MDIEILKIASDTKNHKVLDKCTHKAKQKNSMCGDEMDVSVKIVKDQILDFGYQCKSCIFCQASASVISKYVKDLMVKNLDKIETHKNFTTLINKKYIARKECVLLPYEALKKAINN